MKCALVAVTLTEPIPRNGVIGATADQLVVI